MTVYTLALPGVRRRTRKITPGYHTWFQGGLYYAKAFRVDLEQIGLETFGSGRYRTFFCHDNRCAKISNLETGKVVAEVRAFGNTEVPSSIEVQLSSFHSNLKPRFEKFARSKVGFFSVEIVESL